MTQVMHKHLQDIIHYYKNLHFKLTGYCTTAFVPFPVSLSLSVCFSILGRNSGPDMMLTSSNVSVSDLQYCSNWFQYLRERGEGRRGGGKGGREGGKEGGEERGEGGKEGGRGGKE